jgi:hypothetical protein
MRADASRAARALIAALGHEQPASNRPTGRGTSGADSFQHRWEKPRRFSTRRWERGRARAARCSARGGVR